MAGFYSHQFLITVSANDNRETTVVPGGDKLQIVGMHADQNVDRGRDGSDEHPACGPEAESNGF